MRSLLAVMLVLSTMAVSAANEKDKLINTSTRTESQSCKKSGYCYSYGRKSYGKGYGYRYGHSSSCNGTKKRTVTTKTYIKHGTKEQFQETSSDSWGNCN